MTRSTLLKKIRLLKELESQKASIEENINLIKEEIQAEMISNDTYEYEGRTWKVSWLLVESSRFDQSSFMKDHPDLYKQYKIPNVYRRFLLSPKKKGK